MRDVASRSAPEHRPAPSLDRARGVLESIIAPTAAGPGGIVFSVPGSNYRLHLRPTDAAGSLDALVGKKIEGTIRVRTRRVDTVRGGGRYVEPVFGRPRRVQGTVIAVDPGGGAITLNAGGGAAVDGPVLPIVCSLGDIRQRPEQFEIGTLVSCDVLEGATFTPCG